MLKTTFGASSILNTQPSVKSVKGRQGQDLPVIPDYDLATQLLTAAPHTFVLQGQYNVVDSFKRRHDLLRFSKESGFQPPLAFRELRPDVMWIWPPHTFPTYVAPDGRLREVLPGDKRLQLQIIDTKLSKEAGAGPYIEIVYYILTAAPWLAENNLDDHFVVVPDGAIWPNSYETSTLVKLVQRAQILGTTAPLADIVPAMQAALQPVRPVFETMQQRLDAFFARDLPVVLTVSDWTTLDWQVRQSCSACDFLAIDRINIPGKKQRHPNHCDEEARTKDRATLVPFIGRGSKRELEMRGVTTTQQIQRLASTNVVFQDHSQLRAERAILRSRADSINTSATFIPAGRRTIALPDSSALDLRIYLTVDFDPGSAISYVFGVRIKWWKARPAGTPWQPGAAPPEIKTWVHMVPKLDLDAERDELLNTLDDIERAISMVAVDRQQQGYQGAEAIPGVQFYIWDTVQAKHIRRVMGRHMNDPQIQARFQGLVWRFPPETVMPDADLEAESPIAIIKPVLRQLVALPLAYDYSLLQTAREYCPDRVDPSQFKAHPLFESGLGDQIPYERAHEIWSYQGHRTASGTVIPWNTLQGIMEQTVEKKLRALEAVVDRMTADLKAQGRLLVKAKRVKIGKTPWRARKVCVDGQLWLSHARLEAVSENLENQAIRAMEIDEREARCHSAVLEQRLDGSDRALALATMGIVDTSDVWVYRMRATSVDVKMNPGDFQWALSPADDPSFLDLTAVKLTGSERAARALTGTTNPYARMAGLTKVTVLEIDRDQRWLALRLAAPQFVQQAEAAGYIDLSATVVDVIIDPLYKDFWTEKLEKCLKAIGVPPIATSAPASRVALLMP